MLLIKEAREGGREGVITKYEVGANANPPKNPRRPPKKGRHIPTIIVNAEIPPMFNQNKKKKNVLEI